MIAMLNLRKKYQAREKLEREIARPTGHTTEAGVVKNGSVTLGWFVHNRYLLHLKSKIVPRILMPGFG
jgi:hypothetical protein